MNTSWNAKMKLIKKTNSVPNSPNIEARTYTDLCQAAISNSQMTLELLELGLLGNTPTNESNRYTGLGDEVLDLRNESDTDGLDHMDDRESSRGDMCLPVVNKENPRALSSPAPTKTSGKSPNEDDS